LVKICHNLVLGVVTQILAETTVLAERGGITRADYLDFINGSVMGSTFSQYKTPAFVNLDFTPTFTGHLLRKDFELGLDAAGQLKVPVPVSSLVHEIIVKLIDAGLGDGDYAALLELEARAANLNLAPDARPVSDGLSPENSDDGAARVHGDVRPGPGTHARRLGGTGRFPAAAQLSPWPRPAGDRERGTRSRPRLRPYR